MGWAVHFGRCMYVAGAWWRSKTVKPDICGLDNEPSWLGSGAGSARYLNESES
jgi:hypothetical protein